MYVVFVAQNVKNVADFYMDKDDVLDLRIYMALLWPLLIAFSLVRNLKYLAPFSMVANGLIAAGLGITFYYIFSDLPPIEGVTKIATLAEMPLFFGIAIFALEGIGVVSQHLTLFLFTELNESILMELQKLLFSVKT